MHHEENIRIARAQYDSVNEGNPERGWEYFADELKWMDTPTGQVLDKDGFREYSQSWLTAFPDSKLEINNIIATEEWVVVEVTARGTHTGPLVGPGGTIQPTQRQVTSAGCDIWQIKDGKIVGGRSYYDMASLLSQLGVIELPKAA